MTLETSIAGMVAEAGRLTDAVNTKMNGINAAVALATQGIEQKWAAERVATLMQAAETTLTLDADAGHDEADGRTAPVRTVERLSALLRQTYPMALTVVLRARNGIVITDTLVMRAAKYVIIDITQSGGLRFGPAPLTDAAGVSAGTGLHGFEIGAPVAFVYGSSHFGRPRTLVTVPASAAGPGDPWTFNLGRCAIRMSGTWWRSRMDFGILGCDVTVGPQSIWLGHLTGSNTTMYGQHEEDLRFASVDSSFAVAATGQKSIGWTDLDQ